MSHFPLPDGVCRTVCRPKRRQVRGWTAAGAARIARYAAENDGNLRVAAEVLEVLGYRSDLCQIVSIIVALKEVQDNFALLGAINGFLNILAGAARILRAVSRIFRIIGLLLIAIGTLQVGLVALRSVLEELDLIPDLKDLRRMVCGDVPEDKGK